MEIQTRLLFSQSNILPDPPVHVSTFYKQPTSKTTHNKPRHHRDHDGCKPRQAHIKYPYNVTTKIHRQPVEEAYLVSNVTIIATVDHATLVLIHQMAFSSPATLPSQHFHCYHARPTQTESGNTTY